MDARKELDRLNNTLKKAIEGRFGGSKPVFGEGPVPCGLMVLGEAPGRDETRLGRPFVGKGGSFFIKSFEETFGMGRDRVYISNVLKVWPNVETKRLRTRAPEKDETEFFLPFLMKEIGIVDPKVILAVGKTAFSALFPDDEFRAGEWIASGNRKIMPVYQPSYILRRQKSLEGSVRELKGALLKVREELGL
ncbi:MAG TPA: uracil-DNA glycosylase [Thermodesulfobacteriota bacterium]